ncbi:hypothetical protein J7J18_04395 [bacterium]|nr:hypothetical protein [bacterium]
MAKKRRAGAIEAHVDINKDGKPDKIVVYKRRGYNKVRVANVQLSGVENVTVSKKKATTKKATKKRTRKKRTRRKRKR